MDRHYALPQPVGRHCLIDLYGCPPDLLNDPEFARAALREATRRAGATLVQEILHQFAPHGVTALGLLAESHISIHTWPEYGFAAVDLFLCGGQCTPEPARDYLVDAYRATFHAYHELLRGIVLRGACDE